MMMALCLAAVAWAVGDLYRPYRGFTGSQTVDIPLGTSASTITRLLVSRGVLRPSVAFSRAVCDWTHAASSAEGR